jgi:PilZ domain
VTWRRRDSVRAAHARWTGAVELPTINLLVRLTRLTAGSPAVSELASRVEDVRPGSLGRRARFLVAAPGYPGDLLDPLPGERWLLSWVTERARWELPVHRAEAPPEAGRTGPRAWWLTPAGPVERRQRRRFYRAPCGVPVELDLLSEPFRTLSGRTLDVSEGGLRCLVPLPEGDVPEHVRVLVRVGLDGIEGALGGVVLRSRRPARTGRVAGGHRELAVAFDEPERSGDAVRQVVARLQHRARRLAPPAVR